MALPDIASFSDYGGEKQDYSAPEDPTTDRSAAEVNPAFADVAAGTRTAIRAFVQFSFNGATLDLIAHDSVWGNGVSVEPTLAVAATGKFRVTFPSSVVDALGETHAVNLRAGWANIENVGTHIYDVQVAKVSPTTFTVIVVKLDNAPPVIANPATELITLFVV